MKLFFPLITFFLFLPNCSSAQTNTDVIWYEGLYAPTKRPIDKQIKAAEAKLIEARQSDNRAEEARTLIELGVINITHSREYEKAVDWLVQSLALEDSTDLHQERIFTYLGLARLFEEVGNYGKSIEFLEQASKQNEDTKDRVILSLILNETGRINVAYGKIDDAFENFEIALEIARELSLPAREADALFHLGQVLTLKSKYNESLKNHKEALRIRRSLSDKVKEAQSLNEVGELYRLMKNDERSLANHVAALEIRQKLKNKADIAQSYNNIGVLYFQQKNFKRAIANLDLALDAGREVQESNQMSRSYDYLSRCYKEQKDFKRALEYRESCSAMQDLMQGEKNEGKLLEAQNQYLIGKKEIEIGKLEVNQRNREKIIEQQEKQQKFLFALIALSIVVVVLVLYLYAMKRKSNVVLQEINNTKDKLFSIIGHDLKGPLNSFTAFSSLLINHADKLTKEEIKTLSVDLDKSLKNLMALLENLLEWSRSQTGNIDFKAEEFNLSAMLTENIELLKGQASNKKISLISEFKTGLFAKAHSNSINTVVRNLLSNAIKFTPEGGKIILNIEEGKQWLVSVTDTGVGMSQSTIHSLFDLGTKHSTLGTAKEKGTGLGLILCKDFVEKNGGTIGVETAEGKGSKFYFTVSVLNSIK